MSKVVKDPFTGKEWHSELEEGKRAANRLDALRRRLPGTEFNDQKRCQWLRTDEGRVWMLEVREMEVRNDMANARNAMPREVHVEVDEMQESEVYRLRTRMHGHIDRVSAAVQDLKALKMSRFDPSQLACAFDAVGRAVQNGRGMLVKTA